MTADLEVEYEDEEILEMCDAAERWYAQAQTRASQIPIEFVTQEELDALSQAEEAAFSQLSQSSCCQAGSQRSQQLLQSPIVVTPPKNSNASRGLSAHGGASGQKPVCHFSLLCVAPSSCAPSCAFLFACLLAK